MNVQGKNKRRQLVVYDYIHNSELSVDSQEEVDFTEWLCEAVQLSVINDFQYQPESFSLSQPMKYVNAYGKENTLFQEHVYSPDFIVEFTPSAELELAKEFHVPFDQISCQDYEAVIDVKGTFAKNDGGRSFSINQKWVYQLYKKYVYKLIPKKFFAKHGCPNACILTKKTKKPRTMFKGYKTLQQKKKAP